MLYSGDREGQKMQTRVCACLGLFVLAWLSQAAVFAEDSSAAAKKPVSLVLGYYDSRTVSCNWGNHCRDDLGTAEVEFLKYLDDGKKAVISAASSGTSDEDLPKLREKPCSLERG